MPAMSDREEPSRHRGPALGFLINGHLLVHADRPEESGVDHPIARLG